MVIVVTDVTIRGISDEVYTEFSAEARRQEKAVGDLTTEAMSAYLLQIQGTKKKHHFISNMKELKVSKMDLVKFNRPVVFGRIDRLIFEDDVDLETLEKYVHVGNCKYVEFPKGLPLLFTYELCSNCGQVTRRE